MILFALFTSDQWGTRSTAICHGVFPTFDTANQAAKDENLYNPETKVSINEISFGIFYENIF